ncbi:MAG TPA: vitamin K epoxide reductase family protein [Candidatus Paceibacterota bacterium]
MILVYQSLIIALALFGFGISFHIFRTKKRADVLVCPLNLDCTTVVHSEYSRLLFVPLEWWGMSYYLIAAAMYTLFITTPESYTGPAIIFILTISTLAFLVSIYLTLVQLFILKHFCTWCLISALISITIFIIGFSISEYSIISLKSFFI